MQPDEFERYMQLRERLFACKGSWVLNRRQALARSFNVFARNHEELHTALARYAQTAVLLSLWDVRNRHELHAYMEEMGRLLHNFVAAAKSLVDHTRALVDELYRDTSFYRECAERRSALGALPMVKFVQDLRIYAQHREIPMLQAVLGPVEGNTFRNSAIRLNLKPLRQWDAWSTPAKAYLDGLTEGPSLLELAALYRIEVEGFYRWLEGKESESYLPELEEMQGLYEELSRIEEGSDQ